MPHRCWRFHEVNVIASLLGMAGWHTSGQWDQSRSQLGKACYYPSLSCFICKMAVKNSNMLWWGSDKWPRGKSGWPGESWVVLALKPLSCWPPAAPGAELHTVWWGKRSLFVQATAAQVFWYLQPNAVPNIDIKFPWFSENTQDRVAVHWFFLNYYNFLVNRMWIEAGRGDASDPWIA